MLVGYARVSNMDQSPALQRDALQAAGCGRIFTEKASGAQHRRPELQAALDFLRQGDTLVLWRLARLARSIKQIISNALKVLSRSIDTSTPGGRLFFHLAAAFDKLRREILVETTCARLVTAGVAGRRP